MLALACAGLITTIASTQAQNNSEFNPVVISASKYEQSGIDIPSGATVITRKQINDFGVLTVNEAVMKIGGVIGKPSAYGSSEYNLDLGGYGATAQSNMVVVLDGVRLTDPDQGEVRISSIPIDQVEKIEILYGSNSVLYGESATGGVIHITTNKKGKDKPTFNYYLAAGSNNTEDLKANFSYSSNGLSVNSFGSYRESDNHRQNFHDRTRVGGFNADLDRGPYKLGVSLSEEHVHARLPGSITVASFEQNPYQIRASKINDWANIRNFNSSAYLQANTSLGILNIRTGDRRRDLTANEGGYLNAYDIVGRYSDINAKNVFYFKDYESTLIVGADYSDWQRQKSTESADSIAKAFYIKSELVKKNVGTRFSMGYRNESINRNSVDAKLKNSLDAWDLGLIQPLEFGFSPYVRVAKSYRVPNVDDCGAYLQNYPYTCTSFGNTKPQLNHDKEVGLKTVKSNLRLNLRYTKSSITDEIGYDGSSNTNLGNTLRDTYQFDGVVTVHSKLDFSFVLKHMKSEFVSGSSVGKKVPLVPENTASLNLVYRVDLKQSISYGVTYIGSRNPDGDMSNQYSMPSYHVSDLRYVLKEKDYSYGVTVNNLFNKSYYNYGIPSGGQVYVYPEPKRTLMFHIKSHY